VIKKGGCATLGKAQVSPRLLNIAVMKAFAIESISGKCEAVHKFGKRFKRQY
jgi:hypothetical protein